MQGLQVEKLSLSWYEIPWLVFPMMISYDFLDRGLLPTRKRLNQRFKKVKLDSFIRKLTDTITCWLSITVDLFDRWRRIFFNRRNPNPSYLFLDVTFRIKLITGFVLKWTRLVPDVDLLTLPVQQRSPTLTVGVCVAQSLIFLCCPLCTFVGVFYLFF